MIKMRQPVTISHKIHPARQQRSSLAQLTVIKYCIASNRRLIIGTLNVDALYDKIKFEFPEAKISKGKNCVLIERGD